MTVNKRKKSSRFRGSHTHGWGAKKKHRGSGHRGGRGNAGSGKRADSKKPSFWKDTEYFGKHGFKQKGPGVVYEGINIRTLEGMISRLIKEGFAKEEKGAINIDLGAVGYTKLLSSGRVTKKMIITVLMASPDAVEKIKKAGGEVRTAGKSKPEE